MLNLILDSLKSNNFCVVYICLKWALSIKQNEIEQNLFFTRMKLLLSRNSKNEMAMMMELFDDSAGAIYCTSGPKS